MWVLFVVAGSVIFSIVDMVIGTYDEVNNRGLLGSLFWLATLIPGLALGSRRLHDISRTGWWQLMWLLFFLIISMVVLLWWEAKKGDVGSNRYN